MVEIKKFHGNKSYMSFLVQDNERLVVVYSRIKEIMCSTLAAERDPTSHLCQMSVSKPIVFEFDSWHGKAWHSVTIDNEKDFELINQVLEGILSDDRD